MTVSVRTLGPVEVTVDDAAAPGELLWRKNLALLVYLARSPKRTRARDHLVGLLWGDKPDEAARHSLNEALRVLRRVVGEGGIDTTGGTVRLAQEDIELDVDRFDTLAAAGDWRGAASLVTGEFMEGFAVPDVTDFETWLGAEREQWRRRGTDALLRCAAAALTQGDVAHAGATAARALALAPTADAAMRAVLRALALSGERGAALQQFELFRTRLKSQLGMTPDPETQALADRVRRERMRPEAATKPRVGAESRRAPLVGREADLARVLGAAAAARAGRRATFVLIEGDAGTGRTRLAEEVMARARLDGAAVLVARAVAADVATPWAGVWGLARGGLIEAPGVAAAPPAALAAFVAAIPTWADRFGRPVARADAPGRALSEVIRAVAEEVPVLLVVDDAQWLDEDSLNALAALLRDLSALPLCVLLTAAAPPPPAPAALDALRARAARDHGGVALRLGPLAPAELRTLARWALPRYDAEAIDRVARRVATDSAGLPLLAVELFHAVALGLELHGTLSAWPAPSRTLDQTLPGELPDGVVAAVRVGVRRLSAGAQRVLVAAAVLGDRQPAASLGRAADLEGAALAAALDELEWERWLTAEGRGYDFVARIVRDIVARDFVTPGQQRRIMEIGTAAKP